MAMKHHPEEVWVRFGFRKDEPQKKIKITRPRAQQTAAPPRLYTEPIPLKSGKVKDLEKLAKFVPEPQRQFYVDIISNQTIEDSSDNEDSDQTIGNQPWYNFADAHSTNTTRTTVLLGAYINHTSLQEIFFQSKSFMSIESFLYRVFNRVLSQKRKFCDLKHLKISCCISDMRSLFLSEKFMCKYLNSFLAALLISSMSYIQLLILGLFSPVVNKGLFVQLRSS